MSTVEMKDDLEELLKIAKDAAMASPESITTAVELAEKRARKLARFDEYVGCLVYRALRGMVEDARHEANVTMRAANGEYGGEAKVVPGAAVARVMRSHYLYLVAGKTLGQLTKQELLAAADAEQSKADAHLFNVRLYRKLAEMVPDKKTVQQSINQRKLDATWEEVEKHR